MARAKQSSPRVGKEARKDRFLRLIRERANWLEASKVAGVCERTALRWSREDPAFAEVIDAIREARIAEVEDLTYRLCLDPDSKYNTLRTFFLKSRAGWDEDEPNRGAEAPSVAADPKLAEVAIASALDAAAATKQPKPKRSAGGDESRKRPQRQACKR